MRHTDHRIAGPSSHRPRSRGPALRAIVTAFALSALVWVPVLGAQTNATIEGTITDPDGAALPGVQVSVVGDQVSRTIVSDGAGHYRIPALPPGTYALTATLEGFVTQKVENLELLIGQHVDLPLKMALGAFQQQITVTGERVLLKTDAADTGGVVTPEDIKTLPVNGRDYIDLVALVPGVTVNRNRDKGSDAETPIMGERAGNAVYLVDGMPNRNEFGGGAATQFNQDSISQFEVLTNGFKAEFGHGSGGIINVVTKSGTNELKGMASVFYRDDGMTSSNSLDPTAEVPYLERLDYGFTLGGAIKQDKVFFFGSAEYIHEDRRLDFAFPPATPDFMVERELSFDEPTKTRDTRLFLKLTEQPSARHRLIQQISYNDSNLENWLPLSQADSLPSTRRSMFDNRTNAGLRDESLLGDENNPLVLEAYAQYRHDPGKERPAFPEAGAYTGVSIFSSTDTFGIFGDVGTFVFGTDASANHIDQDYTGLGASLSKYMGDHTVKGGVSYLRTHVDGIEQQIQQNQLFATEANFIEYGPEDAGLLVPLTVGGLTEADSQIRLRNNYTGVYVQDDWKIHPRLTLNVGVRWDYDSEFHDSNNVAPRVGLAWSPDDKTVVRGSWGIYYDRFRIGLVRDVPAFGGANVQLIQPFAYPQLFYNVTSMAPAALFGLCISPNETDAEIAASDSSCPYGPYPYYGYDHLNNVVTSGHSAVPLGTVVTIDNVQELTGYTPDEYLAAVTTAAPQLIPGIDWFWAPNGRLAHTAVPSIQVPVTLDPGFETPYTRAYTVGIQRMIGRDWAVSLDYHHRDFENLLGTRYTNLAFASRLQGFPTWEEPSTSWGINGFGPWFRGKYEAVTVGITKRYSKRYALSVNYTYTDSKDNLFNSQLGGGISVAGGGSLPSDSFVGVPPVVTDPVTGQTNADGSFWASNGAYVPQAGVFYNGPDLDYGTSSLAAEHALVVFGSVVIPWELELSGIYRFQSGFPFSRETLSSVDIDGTGSYNSRDYNYQRNSFNAPDYSSFDLRLSRPFNVGGDIVLTAIVEVFNLFNEQNPAAVETVPGRPTDFGQPLQVLPGREGQVGLRIEF